MSNCPKTIEKKGKSVEEALALALEELGVSENDVTYTVIEEASKGFLGIGSKEAVVRVELIEKEAEAPADTVSVATDFLSQLFSAMNMDVKIDAKQEDDVINIDLAGDDMGIIIGKRGDTLDSLQYLTSLVANKNKNRDSYTRISIDTEGYREKRVESLKALADRLANKVTRSGKKYTLEPMNPYERRIIHSHLQSSETVTTFSIGEDPYRKLVIAPKNEKKRPPRRTPVKPQAAPVYAEEGEDTEELPMTYPGGGKPTDKPKASSFEEYLANQEN